MPPETKHISLEWTEALRFTGTAANGLTIKIDGDNETAPGPMLQLLFAAASCTASDIVLILEKMRQPLAEFSMEATGTRREQEPRRYVALHLIYRCKGEGLDEAKVRRAVELSVEKYCSVLSSLASDTKITYDVEVG